MMNDVQHLSVYIDRQPSDVYAFASNPANLPLWASGLAESKVLEKGGAWVAEAPFGRVTIRFADKNAFGVMDHDVELDDGTVFHNPMRVVPNASGSEFIFTLIRHAGMTDEQFRKDRLTIQKDLDALKKLLEQ